MIEHGKNVTKTREIKYVRKTMDLLEIIYFDGDGNDSMSTKEGEKTPIFLATWLQICGVCVNSSIVDEGAQVKTIPLQGSGLVTYN